jgi:hypothetical protein
MASNAPDAGPQQAPKAWKEMQERYMRKVLVAADDPRYLNGTRRMDGRRRKFAARAPMEVWATPLFKLSRPVLAR